MLGKSTGLPIHQLLGGAVRDDIRVYNTCAGYQYVRSTTNQSSANWGIDAAKKSAGPYEDLEGFLNRAGELAESLLSEGITGMKIWPFDTAAEKSHGQYISNADLDWRSNPFARFAMRWARRWTSWSSSTACGDCPWRKRSPAPSSL